MVPVVLSLVGGLSHPEFAPVRFVAVLGEFSGDAAGGRPFECSISSKKPANSLHVSDTNMLCRRIRNGSTSIILVGPLSSKPRFSWPSPSVSLLSPSAGPNRQRNGNIGQRREGASRGAAQPKRSSPRLIRLVLI